MVELKEQEFDKKFEITAENAIRHLKMAKLLFLTKRGKFCSNIANDYIEKMAGFSVYCKEEEQGSWVKSIEELVYMAGEVDDYIILSELYAYEKTAEVMESISRGYSLEDVRKLIFEQGHFCSTISSLGQKMLCFSPYGVQFVDEVIGDKWLELLENLKLAYNKFKHTKYV